MFSRWILPILTTQLLAAVLFLWIFSYFYEYQLHFDGAMRRDFDSLRGELYFQSFESSWPLGRPPPFSCEFHKQDLANPFVQALAVENQGSNILGFRWGKGPLPPPNTWWFLAIPWWSITLIFALMCALSWKNRKKIRHRAFPVETVQPK